MIRAPAETDRPQVGVVASRRVGSAVRRNRAKRRIREAMMRVALRPETAYVVVATAGVATMEFEELIRRLREAIGRGEREEQR